MFIVSAVDQVFVAIPRPRPSLWISDFHIFSIKHNKCDKSSLNCSDHKLTQLLINRPVAVNCGSAFDLMHS